ncbi:MAG TPA: hypothetical protein VF950_01910 [Planctomycetota bacterium]
MARELCAHLQPILQALLARGGTVVDVAVGAWSARDVVVTVSQGPELEAARALFPGFAPWRVDDPHYAIEFGVACDACRHAIGWPQKNAYS